MGKVLVCIPINKIKLYCAKQLFEFLDNITYQNKDILIYYDTNKYGTKDNIKRIREYFRQVFLKGDYSHCMFIGCDTIPPTDIIEKLMKHNVDVVGGVYNGRPINSDNAKNVIAWKYNGDIIFNGSLQQVDGMGMDCVLFTKNAMSKVSFLDWEVNDDDYPFYKKLFIDYGIHTYLDTNVYCKHYDLVDNILLYSYNGSVYEEENY